jgi:hypothetical protein
MFRAPRRQGILLPTCVLDSTDTSTALKEPGNLLSFLKAFKAKNISFLTTFKGKGISFLTTFKARDISFIKNFRGLQVSGAATLPPPTKRTA